MYIFFLIFLFAFPQFSVIFPSLLSLFFFLSSSNYLCPFIFLFYFPRYVGSLFLSPFLPLSTFLLLSFLSIFSNRLSILPPANLSSFLSSSIAYKHNTQTPIYYSSVRPSTISHTITLPYLHSRCPPPILRVLLIHTHLHPLSPSPSLSC